LKHGIRRKKVRHEKSSEYKARADYKHKCRALTADLEKARQESRKLLFLDEVTFTKLALPNREWSKRHSNLSVEQADVFTGYRSVIACMTESRGMEMLMCQDHAYNAAEFELYLRGLRRRHTTVPLALLMDNLTVHKAKTVKPLYAQLNITPIWNVAYSPEFNPIESAFSIVKRHFCKNRLNDIVNRRGFNFERTIEAAFREVSVAHCRAFARKSRYLLAKACKFEN
jgi:transposase